SAAYTVSYGPLAHDFPSGHASSPKGSRQNCTLRAESDLPAETPYRVPVDPSAGIQEPSHQGAGDLPGPYFERHRPLGAQQRLQTGTRLSPVVEGARHIEPEPRPTLRIRNRVDRYGHRYSDRPAGIAQGSGAAERVEGDVGGAEGGVRPISIAAELRRRGGSGVKQITTALPISCSGGRVAGGVQQ